MRLRIVVGIAVVAMPIAADTAWAQSSPSDFTYGSRYDAMRRVVGTISPDPDGPGGNTYLASRNSYDAAGRLVKTEAGRLANWQSETIAPANWSGFTVHKVVDIVYDAMGRKVKEAVSSDGMPAMVQTITQYSYNSVGRLECTAVRMNAAAFGSLPTSACTLGAQGTGANAFGPDRITRNIYDAAGQLLKVQKAVGTTLQEDYATYTYSPNGKQTSLTDARGYKATMTYDGFDRQKRWYFPSKTATGTASTADYEEYGYDANGNRTSLRKRDGSTITYQYDALNRNTVKIVPARTGLAATHTRDVYYGYDLRGLQTYARFDSGASTSDGVTTAYDGFGRMTSSALKMDGVTRTLAHAYDKNGNRTELTWPDAFKNSYVYDGLDRMATLYQGAIGSTTNMVSYTYNNRGLRATQTGRFGPVTTLGYDAAERLNALSHNVTGTAQDVAFTYAYTPASQIAQQTRNNDSYAWTGHFNVDRSYTANGLNQYTAAGPAAFAYDANGNLTSDGTTTYLYDIENRLVSASGAKSATLRYDPLGRLYETVGGSATTRLLYDGDELVAEYNTSGTLLRRYAHGKNVDDPVVMYEGAGPTAALRWLHTDHQGSIVAITGGTGAIVATNSYDEYGIPAAANSGRFQYTGQAWMPELGMYYYKARIYSPTLGRFLQTDPIGYDDQINLYAYTGNDPINGSDPSGNETCKTDADGNRTCVPDDHTYRDTLAAGGAAVGAVLGGIAGGTAGGTGGAVAGAACGPGAVVCSPAGAAAGGTAGAAAGAAGGAVAGGVVGGLIGNLIDKGIAMMSSSGDDGSSGGKGGDLSGHAQDRMGQRGVTPDRVQEARQIGRVKPGNTPETVVREVPSAASASGRGIRVVIDRATGKVVTVIDKGSKFK